MGNAWVLGLGFKGGRGRGAGTWGRRRAFLEMAVRTAQTSGSVSWIGWSANLRATARTSSGVTLGGVGGATEQDASSLADVLGVTARSAHGSGAIARARRAPPPAAGRAAWRGGGAAEREANVRALAGGSGWCHAHARARRVLFLPLRSAAVRGAGNVEFVARPSSRLRGGPPGINRGDLRG
jgi:hypothetical protein